MRLVILICTLAIACGSSKPTPAPANKGSAAAAPADDGKRPYMHDCNENHKACALDECVAWKKQHGEEEQMATDECMQDCNCGE